MDKAWERAIHKTTEEIDQCLELLKNPKNKVFKVTVPQVYVTTFFLAAADKTEARAQAEDKWDGGKYPGISERQEYTETLDIAQWEVEEV
ncbi:hypothetical protein LCGC14_2587550 [marine sediment metagenome]|uniref:Uncharacterized protein n=1 Tax=marine sediment metagenome TaxID=412755 RepID=A0A0F9B0L3_9ZZZZ